jgi:hypothetical protein
MRRNNDNRNHVSIIGESILNEITYADPFELCVVDVMRVLFCNFVKRLVNSSMSSAFRRSTCSITFKMKSMIVLIDLETIKNSKAFPEI